MTNKNNQNKVNRSFARPISCLAFVLVAIAAAVLVTPRASAATLTSTTMTRSGIDLTSTAAAAAGGLTDKVLNDGSVFLYINNGNAAAVCTVTITWGVGGTVDGVTPTAKTVVIAKSHAEVIGPFPTQFYNDSNGFLIWTYDQVTTVTVAVIKPGN